MSLMELPSMSLRRHIRVSHDHAIHLVLLGPSHVLSLVPSGCLWQERPDRGPDLLVRDLSAATPTASIVVATMISPVPPTRHLSHQTNGNIVEMCLVAHMGQGQCIRCIQCHEWIPDGHM